MRKMGTYLAALCFCAAPMFVGGCSDDANDAETINIMLVLPYTGSFADRGELYLSAFQMAVDDLEADGTLLDDGRKIRLYPVDATSDKAVAQERAEALLDDLGADKVAAIVTATGAGHQGTLQLAIDNEIPHFEIASGSRDDEIVDTSANNMRSIFQLRALCPYLAEISADFICQSGYTRVGLVRGTKAHDITHTDTIRAQLEVLSQAAGSPCPNVAIVDHGTAGEDYVMEYPDSGSPDIQSWTDHMNSYLDAFTEEPEVVFFHLRGDSNNFAFLEEMRAVHMARGNTTASTPDIVTCDMARKPALLDPVTTNVAEWLSETGQNGNTSRFHFAGRGPISSTYGDQFKADLDTRYGKTADRWSKTGYDAIVLVGLAIAGSGSDLHADVTDGVYAHSKGGTEYTYGNVSDALTAARAGEDIDYTGASGSVDIREGGVDDRTVEGEYYIDNIIGDGAGGYEYNRLTDPVPPTIR